MTILPIVQAPDSVLRQKCALISNFGQELQQLINDMFETMYQAEGIGLAAPQINRAIALCIMDTRTDPEGNPVDKSDENSFPDTTSQFVFVNPRIIADDSDKESGNEGCLSIPGYEIAVKRPRHVLIEFEDRWGKTQRQHFSGLPARCVQHEMDHLRGRLIVDYTSQITRSRIFRALRQHAEP